MLSVRAVTLMKAGPAVLARVPTSRLQHNYGSSMDYGSGRAGGSNSNVAVVLSGSGWYDGTDIHEAAYVMFHLSRSGARFHLFAPNIQQMQVVDHTRGQPMSGDSRNVMIESARIARGRIQDLSRLDANSHDAVIFPGGYGITKNLSTYNNDGPNFRVNNDVERVLRDFHRSRKPIGMSCFAPVLAARVLPGVEVTMGQEREEGGRWPYAQMASSIRNIGQGSRHVSKEVTDCNVDEKNRLVTTPGFMCETEPHFIFDGIGSMVNNLLRLANK